MPARFMTTASRIPLSRTNTRIAATVAATIPAVARKRPRTSSMLRRIAASGGSRASICATQAKKPKAGASQSSSTTTSTQARDAKAKLSGMLKLVTAGAPLPKARHILHQRKGICMNFCTQGFYCRFIGPGKECFNLHPAKLEDIPTPIRDPFIRWVATTDSIDWVPGKGPAGTV